MKQRAIPGHRWKDASWAFLREGYWFVRTRCERYDSPLFQTRLLGRHTLCLSGLQAAELFYDAQRFVRTATSTPAPLRNILLGTGGVQGLDGPAHAWRKRLFLEVLKQHRIEHLVQRYTARFAQAVRDIPRQRSLEFLPWSEALLCQAACEWAGVPAMSERHMQRLTRRLASMIDGAGRLDWRMPAALLRRKAVEKQAAGWIKDCRQRGSGPSQDSALQLIAHHRDEDGNLLSPRVAAVELLNVLRPIVAVGRFLLFGLIELERRPEWRTRIADADEAAWAFAEEVRRIYAFFPMIAALVREDFEWQGYRFAKGTRVLLDLFGTNRDPAHWQNPHGFDPERFGHCPMSTAVISQGAGEYSYHRCPGEPLTLMLMQTTFKLLCRDLQWRASTREVDFRRLPMLPDAPVMISGIMPKEAPHDTRN